jgi:hypothetical protein
LALFAAPLFAAPEPDSSQSPPAGNPSKDYAEIWTPRASTGTIHLHGGVFAPINANATSATFGARIGFNLGSHVLLGVLADWSFKSKSLLEPATSGLPGFRPKTLLAKVDAHLIPAMAFLQVRLTDKFPLVPYAGVGAGYEWLILRAIDYRTDESKLATYGNVAWQGYGGLGLRLSKGLRLDGELFYNGGVLVRNVDGQNGERLRETVNVNGVGVRVGLDVVY